MMRLAFKIGADVIVDEKSKNLPEIIEIVLAATNKCFTVLHFQEEPEGVSLYIMQSLSRHILERSCDLFDRKIHSRQGNSVNPFVIFEKGVCAVLQQGLDSLHTAKAVSVQYAS